MRLHLALIVLIALSACSPSVREATPAGELSLPPELADCKFFELYDGTTRITVGRCPSSTTSVTVHAKNPVKSITVDEAADLCASEIARLEIIKRGLEPKR